MPPIGLPVAPRHAARNRARQAWHAHAGWPALAALGLALAAALLQFAWRPAQERSRAALAARTLQLERVVSTARAASAAPGSETLAQLLPDVASRGQDVGTLLATAKRTHLSVERADYTVETVSGAPLTRLHANLPVTGRYVDIRRFIAEVLNAMPNATMESLQLERPDTRAAQLQATLRIVLFYRTGRS